MPRVSSRGVGCRTGFQTRGQFTGASSTPNEYIKDGIGSSFPAAKRLHPVGIVDLFQAKDGVMTITLIEPLIDQRNNNLLPLLSKIRNLCSIREGYTCLTP
jgi:hypothetical protein